MPAANTDKFRKVKSNFSTTLNGAIGSGDTTIALNSVSGLPTDTAVTLTIDRVDSNGTVRDASFWERVTGVISGSNLTSVLRAEDSTTAQAHSNGAVVELIWDGEQVNDIITGILVEHNQDGTHNNTLVAMLAGAQTFTGAKTFGSALLLATRPKITTSIDDANGNEVIITPATASAVNEITVTNAATGGTPTIAASGETNVDVKLAGKGTGKVVADAAYGVYTSDTDGATVTFNMATSNLHTVTLGGNRTLAVSNTSVGQRFVLVLKQDGTGSRTVTWFSGISWAGGSAPTLTTTINKADAFGFITVAAGTYYGFVIGQNI